MADAPPASSTAKGGTFGFLGKKVFGKVPVWVIAVGAVGAWYWYSHYGPGKKTGTTVTDPAGNTCSALGPTGYCPNTPEEAAAIAATSGADTGGTSGTVDTGGGTSGSSGGGTDGGAAAGSGGDTGSAPQPATTGATPPPVVVPAAPPPADHAAAHRAHVAHEAHLAEERADRAQAAHAAHVAHTRHLAHAKRKGATIGTGRH